MKYILIFIAILMIAVVLREVLTKSERTVIFKKAGRLMVPVLIALAAVASAIFLSILPTLKVL